MKRFAVLLAALLLFSLAACGKRAEPAPSAAPAAPTAAPAEEPALPELRDPALEAILTDVLSVYPGAAGSSLRGAACAARLLDWGMATPLNDDEIYSATGCFLDTLSDQDLLLFFESLDTVYNMGYNLKGESAEGLLSDAGVTNSAWPWNDQAFHAMEMVYLGCGAR